MWSAEEKALGLLSPIGTALDGAAGFATDIPTNLLEGVALHELTHAMGRVDFGAQPDIFDLYRYTGAGSLLFSGQTPAAAAYFSLDGGATALAAFGQTSDPSDFLNSSGLTPGDAFNEFYSGSTLQSLTHVDILLMEALGYHATIAPPPSLANAGSPATYHPSGAAVDIAPLLSVTDTGATTIASATVVISGGFLAGDALNFTNQNGITGSYNGATGVLALTGTASLANYQTALDAVTFTSVAADPTHTPPPIPRMALRTRRGLSALSSTTGCKARPRSPPASRSRRRPSRRWPMPGLHRPTRPAARRPTSPNNSRSPTQARRR